jgi:DNA polymerase-3 subunit beta
MNGVFFEKTTDIPLEHSEGGENSESSVEKLVMVATDGRRLAYVNKDIDGVSDFPGVIIPPKMLIIIMRHTGEEGKISICVTDKNIFIKFGSYYLSSSLIDGQFPNYRRVIPQTQEHFFVVKRMDMLDSLRRVSLLVEQKSRRIHLDLKPGSLSIYSDESDIGTANEEIPCRYNGEGVIIALNYRYIEDPFKIMTDDEIGVYFTDPKKAITIQPMAKKDFFHIVMPMQVD